MYHDKEMSILSLMYRKWILAGLGVFQSNVHFLLVIQQRSATFILWENLKSPKHSPSHKSKDNNTVYNFPNIFLCSAFQTDGIWDQSAEENIRT
jgi:hypothetical protein